MLKYAKVLNKEIGLCEVGTGTNAAFYQSIGMSETDVEQAYNGDWYLTGYAPEKPASVIAEEEIEELKAYLTSTDYVAIKIAEGEATADEYAEVLAKRKESRARINKLEAELNPVEDDREIEEVTEETELTEENNGE
jgi:hypothetical protein